MSYATREELEARLAPDVLAALADDDGDEAVDAGVLEAALADASAEINQLLDGRYVTPINPFPPILTRWCVDLAIAHLFLRKRQALPEEQAERAQLTRRALEAVATGLAGLGGVMPRPEPLGGQSSRLGQPGVFCGEALGAY